MSTDNDRHWKCIYVLWNRRARGVDA